MPELPEVETVVRLLNRQLAGATIDHVEWKVPSLLKGNIHTFSSLFHHQTITSVTRRAKYILIHFHHGYTLVSHLRMEGKYREIVDNQSTPSPYAHVLFYLKDGRRIDYQDVRKFGTFEFIKSENLHQLKSLAQLGPEPFDITDIHAFHAQLSKSSRSIKSILLDQTFISGLGNIYVDETLFAAFIHPGTQGKELSLIHVESLIKESQRILKEAIESGGSRIRSYSSGQPMDGQFNLKINVYQKHGTPCPRCHHRLARTVIAGRGTHFCPRCQHDSYIPFVVGITGSMASGKSTFLQRALSEGYPVLSADDLVHSLYQKPSIQRQLKHLIHPNVIQNKHVNGSFLLEWLLQASSHVKKLEAWLHPRVINSIVNWLKKQNTIAFVEIPLLFQSHADAFIDFIVAIDRPFEERKKTIQSRHPNRRWEPYVLLDEKNMWKQYRPFIDRIIENEGSLEAFHQRIHDLLQSAIAASRVE